MAKTTAAPSQFFEAAGNTQGVAGTDHHLPQVPIAELMLSPPKAVRPRWMVARFPVSNEEFERHKHEAAAPSKRAAAKSEGPTAQEDTAVDPMALAADTIELDRPEDAHIAAPGQLAPSVGASFDGL